MKLLRKEMKLRFFFIHILILLLLTTRVFSEEYNYITEISVKGNDNASYELIKATSELELGDIYLPENVSQAIRNIYKLGLFENINIKKSQSEKGINLTIEVVEHPILQKINVIGNKKIKLNDINSEINLEEGNFWRGQKKLDTKNKIIALYYEKGYNLVTVLFEEEQLKSNRINLKIIIEEGQKVSINEINFVGNFAISDKKLRSEMKTKENSLFRSGEFKPEIFEEDLTRIEKYFHKQGFIDATVLSWNSEHDDEGNLLIKIEVYEGLQHTISSIAVEGNSRFSDEEILDNLDIKIGQILDQERLNENLIIIQSMYSNDGYSYAAVYPELQRDDEEVDIIVKVSEGPRAKVRKIFIKGNTTTKEKIIRRNLAIVPGDYFKQSLLRQTHRNIYNLGYFEQNIGFDYNQINDNGDVDIIFTVEEKSSGSANAGVSFDQTNKLVGVLSFSHNNLFGNAWRISAQWEFSGIKQNYSISFTDPYVFDRNTLLGFDVYHTKENWSDWNYIVRRSGGGIRIGTRIPWIDHSKIIFGHSLIQKKYDYIDAEAATISGVEDLINKGSQLTSSFSFTLKRDGRNNIFRPTEGSLISSYTEIAGGPFGGEENYWKEIFQTNWYLPLFGELGLGLKWRIAYAKAFGETESVPLDERFYPGGIGVEGIRGYDDRSIVPSSEGANAEMICSSEISIPISGDQIIGVLFFDAGNSYKYLSDININELKKGSGLGVRIMTPMGLLGFDYAYGFDNDADNKWKFHFQFGSMF